MLVRAQELRKSAARGGVVSGLNAERLADIHAQ